MAPERPLCPGAHTPGEAWALIAADRVPRWCWNCKMFRKNGHCTAVDTKRHDSAMRGATTCKANGLAPNRRKP